MTESGNESINERTQFGSNSTSWWFQSRDNGMVIQRSPWIALVYMSYISYFVGFPPKVVRQKLSYQKLFLADCQCYLNGTIDGSNVCETTNHFHITVSYVYLDIKKKLWFNSIENIFLWKIISCGSYCICM